MFQPAQSEWTITFDAPVGPQLYRMLRKRIISNDLLPGSRISESEIAGELNISRQPVREAFIKLAEERLVDIRPQRGTYVCKISNSAVTDGQFVREAIEADIVKLLAEAADPVLAQELRGQIIVQRDALKNEPAIFNELDERFHRTLAEAAGKFHVWGVIEGLKAHMDRVRYLSLRQFPFDKLVAQHADIADAIARGDGPAAAAAMRGHMRNIFEDLPLIATENPEYFE